MGEDNREKINDGVLDKLHRRLYKEGETFKQRFEREKFYPTEKEGVPTYWTDLKKKEEQDISFKEAMSPTRKKKRFKLSFWHIFLGLILLTLGFAAFLFRNDLKSNYTIITSKNVSIVIEGPSLVKAGEFTKWQVSVTNNNKTKLELADLVVDYPANSISSDNVDISRERRTIGQISPGQTIRVEIGVYLLGQEDEQKDIIVTLEYRAEGTNAILAKSKIQMTKISRAPVGVTLSLPNEVESGQQVTIKVDYVSNSGAILKDLRLKLEYPPGFHYISSVSEPISGNNFWNIGDLSPNEKRSFEIKGTLEGQDLTDMGFKAIIGKSGKLGGDLVFVGSGSGHILLKRPFINFSFETDKGDAARSGDSVYVTVPWKNNLPFDIRDTVMTIKLVGDPINRRSIFATGGFYRSDDDSIVWNASTFPNLKFISTGGEGMVRFSFKITHPLPVKTVTDKNFTFKLEGTMEGTRVSADGQTSVVRSVASKEYKIITNLDLVSKVSHSTGPFKNTGPVPLRVGQETSYTITWSVSNSYNDVNDLVVHASLPPYVKWFNIIEPSSEQVFYDSVTGELTWRIGKLEAGTGILNAAREVSFQISLVPALNQIESTPILVFEGTAEAKDAFTGTIVKDTEINLLAGRVEE